MLELIFICTYSAANQNVDFCRLREEKKLIIKSVFSLMWHSFWVARRTVETLIFLKPGGFSQQGLFYLLKVPNFFFLLLSSQRFSLAIISPELWYCVFYSNATSISSLTSVLPFMYVQLYYLYCFLGSVTEPCFVWAT